LSQTQSMWAANYMRSQPSGKLCSMQMQPQDEEGYMRPQSQDRDNNMRSQDGDYCLRPQPLAANCDDCGEPCYDNCCECWSPGKRFFAEYLYLQPLNASVEYAVPINGPISSDVVPLQEGRTAAVNPSYSSGFRVGGALWLDDCSAISASYSRFENTTDDAISINPPLVIRSMVSHPSAFDAAEDWLDASARQYIQFDLADLDFQRVLYSNECTTINYLVGIRYANLKQEFTSLFESEITENVNTLIKFEGGGFRLGLQAERQSRRFFFAYAKAAASFLGGEFRGSYLQTTTPIPVVAQTDWKEARFVTILDCEVGLGWKSCNDRWRASAGYQLSGWSNVVKTGEFISSVQANKYHGPDKISGNGIVFGGLVANVEYNW
jgi:hypothetical protein